MLGRIKAFFEEDIAAADAPLSTDNLRLASAALLVEVATVDNCFDEREASTLKAVLRDEYSITQEESEALMALAKSAQENATSMYQFTQLVDQRLEYKDKCFLLVHMWRIAYADGNLDKYEEYIIRKTADLLHINHSDFILAKHKARPQPAG